MPAAPDSRDRPAATVLGPLFKDALHFAVDAHANDTRKATGIPYVSHPLQVAGIALEHGADEDEAAAALLHDVIEDTQTTRQDLERRFNARVAHIVAGCSDSDGPDARDPWRQRKERYLAHLAAADRSTALVSCADKLHNAGCILRDYRRLGEPLWDRFNGSRDDILWYYDALVAAFRGTQVPPDLVAELARTVDALHARVRARKG